MKAAVYYAPGDIRVENRTDPEAGRNELLARVKCCSICGTDLKILMSGNPRCHPPRIIGHEMAAEIIYAGPEAAGFGAGDRITMATTISCGRCRYCRMGLGNLCGSAKPVSYDFDGAFAEYIKIPAEAIAGGNVIKVPSAVPDDAAALCEPISCAVNSHEIAMIGPGDTVAVIGGGPLGAIHCELAKAEGAGKVMLVEMSEIRLELLRSRLKGIVLIDASNEDVLERVRAETKGDGADAVIVCAPARSAMEQALALARKGGAVNLFASLPKGSSDIVLDSRLIHYNELRVTGTSDSRPEHVRKAVDLLESGMIDHEALITHRLPLDMIHKGFELMKNKESIKILIYPGGMM